MTLCLDLFKDRYKVQGVLHWEDLTLKTFLVSQLLKVSSTCLLSKNQFSSQTDPSTYL